MATHLHSFIYRMPAATAVVDAGARPDQMKDFFDWANAKMTMEYIFTSKASIIKVVQKLEDTDTQDNRVHVNIAEEEFKERSKLAYESAEVAQESQVSGFGEIQDERGGERSNIIIGFL